VPFVFIGENISYNTLDIVFTGTKVIDVIEMVAVITAKSIVRCHPDIAVGILGHVENLIAG
jgi:hypothetical protein